MCFITKEYCPLQPSGEIGFRCLKCKSLIEIEDIILGLRGNNISILTRLLDKLMKPRESIGFIVMRGGRRKRR